MLGVETSTSVYAEDAQNGESVPERSEEGSHTVRGNGGFLIKCIKESSNGFLTVGGITNRKEQTRKHFVGPELELEVTISSHGCQHI